MLSSKDIFFLEKSTGTDIVYYSAFPYTFLHNTSAQTIGISAVDVRANRAAISAFSTNYIVVNNTSTVHAVTGNYNTFNIKNGIITSISNTYPTEVGDLSSVCNTRISTLTGNMQLAFYETGSGKFTSIGGGQIIEQVNVTGTKLIPTVLSASIFSSDIEVKLLWNDTLEAVNYKDIIKQMGFSDLKLNWLPKIFVVDNGQTLYEDSGYVKFSVKQFQLSAPATFWWTVKKYYHPHVYYSGY